MIHWTYAWTSTPCSSRQMQKALIRIVCIAPGHDQVGVAGRVEPERDAQPDVQRLVVAAPGVHDEGVRRHEDRLPPPEAGDPHVHRGRRRRGPTAGARPPTADRARGGPRRRGQAGAGCRRRALERRSCSSRSCWATTWSRYVVAVLPRSSRPPIVDAYQSCPRRQVGGVRHRSTVEPASRRDNRRWLAAQLHAVRQHTPYVVPE